VTSHCLDAILLQSGAAASLAFAVVPMERRNLVNAQDGLPQMTGRSLQNGRIQVCDLYPGDFELLAFGIQGAGEAPTSFGKVRVTVPYKGVDMVLVHTSPTVTVSGEVGWEGKSPESDSRREIVFSVSPRSYPRALRVPIPGKFEFQAIPTLEHSVRIFAGLDPPLYVKEITYGQSSILNSPFIPVNGEKLRIVVGTDGGSIAVAVHDDSGRASANASVAVIPENQPDDGLGGMILGRCDNSGNYVASGLAPGGYYVFTTQESLTYGSELSSRLWSARGEAQKIQLAANGTTTVNAVTKKIF